jgi:two-component system cell cycle sensor histidine kinase PleC
MWPLAPSHADDADPRILKMQVERAAFRLGGSFLIAPLWASVAAIVTSELVPQLGGIGFAPAACFVSIVCAAVLITHLILRRFDRDRRGGMDQEADARWLVRLLLLNVLLSSAWGIAPWLLWREGSLLNHAVLMLICLAAVARFLVNRSNHMSFLLASFLPMTGMLFLRCVMSFEPVDLVLAGVLVLYAVQVILDSKQISHRWDQEAHTRFSHEDLSRELEEARDEALIKRAEAEAANASKTAFLANISHELRTPLNAILGFSELIARECLGPVGSPRYKEYANDIHNSGTHLLSLINDLLDVAKIEAGRMEVEPQMVETERTLESALKFVAAKARDRGQTLTISVDPSAAVLYADERALKQIVINLVSNAVKFTQDGGRIEVSAARNAQSDFQLVVADNGPGITREKIDRVFKPFTQADNRYDRQSGGTGLGLALVRGLCELHGGRAWIESEPGRGTRAYVVLPGNASKSGAKQRIPA